MVLNLVKGLIPFCLKRYISNFFTTLKYSVKIEKGAYSKLSTFGRSCTVSERSKVFLSTFGKQSYIANDSVLIRTKVGSFCSLGDNIRTGLGRHPTSSFVSTHPCFYSPSCPTGKGMVEKQIFEDHLFADDEQLYHVLIGNDVWVGNNVMIMDGVKISNGAVVAGGSVVTKDVAPYSIVGGVPARHIKYRFNNLERTFLQNLEWWNKEDSWIQKHAEHFDDIEKLMGILKERP